ncbi:hypothetical protein QTH90_23895 [Variovorax sp. J2P1-59]|uniref:hypothetical protein n=1 Tax=Variovorax flavidus TaxID=3053501 RepID=UPI002575E3D2|nr:hypothetical protein [Variovorax sp. J2P1-59]MDM0077470.1 hypothetical protein [Variovorax sp. J2P1-59]
MHIAPTQDRDGEFPSAFKPADTEKAFATLAAQYALKGHELIRSNPADGAAAYYAMRCGMVKAMPTLDAALAFLVQIGGAA